MTTRSKLPPGVATIALCFITALLEGLDLQSVGIAAPGIGAEFKLAPAAMGWVFSAGLVGLLPGSLIGGWLAGRPHRPQDLLVWAVLLFGIFSFVTAHAWDYPSMLAARMVTGLGLGAALLLLINAAGFGNVHAIAQAPGVQRLLFGSIDFQLDLGIRGDREELLFFRSQLVLVSRLAGIGGTPQ